jgi:hypothetical protein
MASPRSEHEGDTDYDSRRLNRSISSIKHRTPFSQQSSSDSSSDRDDDGGGNLDDDYEVGREAHDDWMAELRYRAETRPRSHSSYRNNNRDDRSKYNIIMCFRCSELGHSTEECLTFKTKLCKHYMNGWCKLDDSRNHCSYAHGESELRKPWLKKCVRVWSKKNGDACVGGCGKVGHTYTECSLYQ